MKTRYLVFGAGGLLLGAALGLFLHSAGPAVVAEVPAPARAPLPTSFELDDLADRNFERLSRVKAALATRPADEGPSVRTHSARTIRRFTHGASAMHAARRMFNRDQLQGAELEALASDPAVVDLAYDTVVDVGLAIEAFGDDQAFARVAALRLVRYLAEHDHPEYLEEAVHQIGATLNERAQWEKGIQFDYVELLAAHIRQVGLEGILQSPESFFEQAQLSPRTSLEVQKAFADAGILRGADQEKIDRLAAYFPHRTVEGTP